MVLKMLIRQDIAGPGPDSADMCMDMYIDMCMDVCMNVCTDMCAGIGIDMCIDVCVDWAWLVQPLTSRHAHGRTHGQVYRHCAPGPANY